MIQERNTVISMSMNNLIVGQSGGPTAVINSSLYGVVSEGLRQPSIGAVYGMVNGIEGFLAGRVLNFEEALPGQELEKLKTTPGAYLGSCRYKLPENLDDPVYPLLFQKFEELGIGYFFYIGGNDSMDTVLKLSEYAERIGSDVRIIGIPKTIDNDLMVTDHTPGFGSAAKYIASSLLEIAHDTFIYAVKSVTIVEIMGRDAGWLTAASALARNEYSDAPHLIYLPECNFDKEEFLTDVRALLEKHNNIIIAVSEGIHDAEGNYICAGESKEDTFGHSQLSGAGKALEYLIKDNINVKVRSVEVNVLQRCAAHLSSATDLNEAVASGEHAVAFAKQGITASMVTMNRTSNAPYTIEYGYAEIKNIANEAKSVPRAWINERGNDVTEEMVAYLLPLIQGETSISYENGLPNYMNVSHLTNKR